MNLLVEQVLHQGEGSEGSAQESAKWDCGGRRGHASGALRLLRHQPECATGEQYCFAMLQRRFFLLGCRSESDFLSVLRIRNRIHFGRLDPDPPGRPK